MEKYTFYMPGEERIFFSYFHTIVIVCFLLFSALSALSSDNTLAESLQLAAIFVAPLYILYFLFRKRFASEVTLDFTARKIRFSFSDERGTIEQDFKAVNQIHFQYYLTFETPDAKIMIKRPKNKKEVFEMLAADFKMNRGIFAAP